MTDCWVNIMPRQVVHGLHLHPLSTISGAYYVRRQKAPPGLKFEDPRLDRFMAAPPRKATPSSARPWIVVPARRQVVLFESWLRHAFRPTGRKSRSASVSTTAGSEFSMSPTGSDGATPRAKAMRATPRRMYRRRLLLLRLRTTVRRAPTL